ncbi:MAG: outer membrane protein assembly factor BamD [Chitinispirillales bacterium]|jgi:outer membrane protein assembly factor BamD|nr:outer membrane protein assembly factor BamD [Chitinispirillales bacterium]
MKVKWILVFTVAAAFIICGCASNSSKLIKKGLYKCESRFETAKKNFDKRNYGGAIRILDEIKYQCGGSPMMDTVIYYTAMSHFHLKQYIDARTEFENLQHEHPRSPFVEEARYRLAQMRYLQSRSSSRDQSETREAVRLFGDYMDLYPQGVHLDSARHFSSLAVNKLAEKEFNIAMFYRKQREHEAALIYFRTVMTQYPESKFTSESVIGMVEALTALGRVEDAREIVDELDIADFSETLRRRLDMVKLRLASPVGLHGPEVRKSKSKRARAKAQAAVADAARVIAETEAAEAEAARVKAEADEAARIKAEEEAAKVEAEEEEAPADQGDVDNEQSKTGTEPTEAQAEQAQGELKQPETETEKSKASAEPVKFETGKSGAEIKQLKAEPEQLKVEPQQLKFDAEKNKVEVKQLETEPKQPNTETKAE